MTQLHLVGYSEQGGAHLKARGPAGILSIPLEGDFAWRVSASRRCTGRWEEHGHLACPTAQVVGDAGQCLPCSGLENPACVFEPLCRSDPASCKCLASFKGVEHVVYVAFFGPLAKVGLTQAWRVGRRLREQGADAYLVVRGGLDRAGARGLESSLSFLHGVPEHRSHRETLPLLARPVPWQAVLERAEAWRERLAADHPVGPVTTITDHPLAQPLPAPPRRVAPWGRHAGTWIGAKGNHLFFHETARPDRLRVGGRPVLALKRSDLLGRLVDLEATSAPGGAVPPPQAVLPSAAKP